MANSQLIKFSSSDPGGPGPITGAASSLINVLDAVLTGSLGGGYPIANAAALGWTKPFANASNIGCYKQSAGAGLGLVVNDAGPNVTSTFREAWATGWEVVAGVGSPVGTGTGQFPTPAQLNTTGQVVVRKSATADSTPRPWTMFADKSTFYLFILTGDSAGTYWGLWFGDVFSLAGSVDAYRCIIYASNTQNTTASNMGNMEVGTGTNLGLYIARSWGNTGSSVNMGKLGDYSLSNAAALMGIVQTPNGPDNSFYLSPLRIADATPYIRGRFRGIYQICHPSAAFADGQTFAGGGDFAGKSFVVVKAIPNNQSQVAFLAVETSNTVETN